MSAFNFPSTIEETVSIEIPKHSLDVFNFVATHFLDNYPKWSPEVEAIESLSQGDFDVGFKFKQVRVDRTVKMESILTVTEYDPHQKFSYVNAKDHYRCSYFFEMTNESKTQLTCIFDLENIELMMRPFSKLIRTAIKEGLQQTSNNIKQLILNM